MTELVKVYSPSGEPFEHSKANAFDLVRFAGWTLDRSETALPVEVAVEAPAAEVVEESVAEVVEAPVEAPAAEVIEEPAAEVVEAPVEEPVVEEVKEVVKPARGRTPKAK